MASTPAHGTAPGPLPWRLLLRFTDAREQQRCEGYVATRGSELAAWLRCCGWEALDAGMWRHEDHGAVRDTLGAVAAQVTADAQAVLEPAGWRLSLGVVVRTSSGKVWLNVLELLAPCGHRTERYLRRALEAERIDTREPATASARARGCA